MQFLLHLSPFYGISFQERKHYIHMAFALSPGGNVVMQLHWKSIQGRLNKLGKKKKKKK